VHGVPVSRIGDNKMKVRVWDGNRCEVASHDLYFLYMTPGLLLVASVTLSKPDDMGEELVGQAK
jgi:hypothetical protein